MEAEINAPESRLNPGGLMKQTSQVNADYCLLIKWHIYTTSAVFLSLPRRSKPSHSKPGRKVVMPSLGTLWHCRGHAQGFFFPSVACAEKVRVSKAVVFQEHGGSNVDVPIRPHFQQKILMPIVQFFWLVFLSRHFKVMPLKSVTMCSQNLKSAIKTAQKSV